MNEEKCGQCGAPASPGAKFCEGCGAPVAATTQTMQPSVPTTQLKEIIEVPVVQLAKVIGIVYAILFFIIGIFYGLAAGVATSAVPNFGVGGLLLAILIIIVMPIIGFIVGFIESAVLALIYNWVVPRIGGIQVKVK